MITTSYQIMQWPTTWQSPLPPMLLASGDFDMLFPQVSLFSDFSRHLQRHNSLRKATCPEASLSQTHYEAFPGQLIGNPFYERSHGHTREGAHSQINMWVEESPNFLQIKWNIVSPSESMGSSVHGVLNWKQELTQRYHVTKDGCFPGFCHSSSTVFVKLASLS